MPIYEYKCVKCGHFFEKLIINSCDENVICPECNAKQVKKMLSSVSFIGMPSGDKCASNTPNGFS